jgi:hypothetical protein
MSALDVFARLIASEPLSPAFKAGVQQHRASCGRRRVFLSAADVYAYERGYAHWPEPLPPECLISTPMSQGWFDADHDAKRAAQRQR